MEKLYKALTEQKYRVKLIKKGNHWVARGMTILLFGLGVIALSNVEVQASSWHANSPAEIAKRISSNDRTFTFERGDTFWGISQVLNINYQTLMEWNGYKSSDEYTIPVGTVISIRGNRLTFTTPNGNVILDKIIQPQDRITQTSLPTPAIITNKQKTDNSSDNSNNSGSDSNREFPTDKGNVDSGNNGNNTDNSGNDSSNIPTDNGNVDTGNSGNNNTNNSGSDNSQELPTDNGNVDAGNNGNNNTNNSGSDNSQELPTDNGNVDTGNSGNNNTNNSGSDSSNIPTDNGNVDTGNSDNNANNSGSDNSNIPTDNGNVDTGNSGNNNNNNSGSDNSQELPTDNGNVDAGNNGNNNTNNSDSDNSNIPTDNGNVDTGNSDNNANNSGSDNNQELPTDNGNVDAGNNGNNNTNNSGSDNSNIPTDNGNVDTGNSDNNANNSSSDNNQELPTDNGNVDAGNNGNNNTNNSGSDNNGGPSSIDEVSPSKPEQPKIDISPLQNLLMANSNIVSLPIYYNASENNRLAFDALMSEAKSLQYKLSLTNEEMVAMIDKLTAAKNNLNGKATDFSKADELLEEYNNRDNNQRYHNATAPSQLAYDNAINELKKLQNTTQVTQATVDSAIANVIEAKNQLDGKVLSTEEQNKFDAIKSFKEDIAYYQEAIKYLPDAYRTAAEGLLQTQGLKCLAKYQCF